MMPLLLRSGCSFLLKTPADWIAVKGLKALTWIFFLLGIPSWSDAEGVKELTAGIETEKRDLSQEISALLRA